MPGSAETSQARPPTPGTQPVRPLSSRMTLTARLTALYTLVSATVLLGLGGLTLYAVQRHFDELDQATLRDKVHLVQELGSTSASLAEFTARLHDVMHSHEGLAISVRRADQLVFTNQSSAGTPGGRVVGSTAHTRPPELSEPRRCPPHTGKPCKTPCPPPSPVEPR